MHLATGLTGVLLKPALPECSLKPLFLFKQVLNVRGSAPFKGRFHLPL